MEALLVADDVQAHAQPVARDDLHAVLCAGENAAIGIIAEHGIVDDHCGERAERADVADILFGAIVPGAAWHGLSDPTASPGLGDETATRRSIIRLGREPVAVTTLGRAGIDETPSAKSGSIPEAKVIGRVAGKVEAVIQHAPAA